MGLRIEGDDGGAGANKTIFIPVERANSSGDYRGKSTGASSQFRISGSLPADFNNLVSAVMAGIITGAALAVGQTMTLDSDAAAPGEDAQTHSENDPTASLGPAAAANLMIAPDVSSVMTLMLAGDKFGIMLTHNAIGTTIMYLGLEIVYN